VTNGGTAFVSTRQSNLRGKSRYARAAVLFVAAAWISVVLTHRAQALPSFARQTGESCASCHVDFPQLTPFGRRFKLGGYTLGGGENTKTYKRVFGSSQKVPPISFMAVAGFTHTQAPQDPGDLPIGPNDNLVGQELSAFYGGAITENLGAFVQATYSGPSPNFGWDNADVRFTKSMTIGKSDVIFGITAHNNPTVQDVWNTLPAWGFPFVGSEIAPGPSAATVIDQAFAQHVAGVGAYAFVNNMLYLEASAYKQLTPRQLKTLGVDPVDGPPGLIDGVSPYFRIAAEPNWGNHWLEFGAFGFMTSVNPFAMPDVDASTFSGTDKYTDLGADAQYQYMGDDNIVTLRAVYVNERQKRDASVANGLSANSTDTLNTFRAQASLAHNKDNRIVLTGGYFNTWGSSDSILYGDNATTFSPDSDGWIAELAYIPFGTSSSPLWPWFNARVGLQYVWYNKFNGASTNYDGKGTNASDNNTLFAYLWVAM
jgi:hypothetical protein